MQELKAKKETKKKSYENIRYQSSKSRLMGKGGVGEIGNLHTNGQIIGNLPMKPMDGKI